MKSQSQLLGEGSVAPAEDSPIGRPIRTAIVEFIDRESDYWEVVEIPHRPATVLQRVRELLAETDCPEWKHTQVAAKITKSTIVIEFDHGDFHGAENIATMFALTLGWRKQHGVLVGRAD